MVGTRIAQKRKERGLSVQDLANQIGVAKTTIYRYENGAIEKMPVERLIKIARVLGTSPQYLMFGLVEGEGAENDRQECFSVPRKLTPQERQQMEVALLQLLTREGV